MLSCGKKRCAMKINEITKEGFYTRVNESETIDIIEFYNDTERGPVIEVWGFIGLDFENNSKKYALSESFTKDNLGKFGEIEVVEIDKKFYEYDGVLCEDKPSYMELEKKLSDIKEELSHVLDQDEFVGEGKLWKTVFAIERLLK